MYNNVCTLREAEYNKRNIYTTAKKVNRDDSSRQVAIEKPRVEINCIIFKYIYIYSFLHIHMCMCVDITVIMIYKPLIKETRVLMIMSIPTFVHDHHTIISNDRTCFPRFSGNSEANVSELLEILKKCFIGSIRYMYSYNNNMSSTE